MLIIDESSISITRGDDGYIDAVPKLDDESEYPMQDGDSVVLTVREKPTVESPVLLQVRSAAGSTRIVLRGADTAELTPGRYSADLQLDTADGKHYTFWPTLAGSYRYTVRNYQNFVIMPEVTM